MRPTRKFNKNFQKNRKTQNYYYLKIKKKHKKRRFMIHINLTL